MKPEFYIIDPETPSEIENGCAARGPFASVKAAEKWLRDDCRDTFLGADNSLRENDGENWATPLMIVQVVRRVQPCPTLRVDVVLRNVSNVTGQPRPAADSANRKGATPGVAL